jgi:anti-anti-sigma factor
MSQVSPELLNIRKRLGGMAIVTFTTPYLQTEDVIERVGAELTELAEVHGYNKLIVSFDGVRFASSSMLAQVFTLHKKVTKSKGWLKLCCVTPTLKEILRASQLDRLLEVHETEEAAVAKS